MSNSNVKLACLIHWWSLGHDSLKSTWFVWPLSNDHVIYLYFTQYQHHFNLMQQIDCYVLLKVKGFVEMVLSTKHLKNKLKVIFILVITHLFYKNKVTCQLLHHNQWFFLKRRMMNKYRYSVYAQFLNELRYLLCYTYRSVHLQWVYVIDVHLHHLLMNKKWLCYTDLGIFCSSKLRYIHNI